MSLLIASVIWQCLILFSKPFESKTINIISFCNEVAVSVYLYVAFLQSDFLETQVPDDKSVLSNLRLNFAWILTGILILTIFINFVFVIVRIAIPVLRYIKTRITLQNEQGRKYLQREPIVENAEKEIRRTTDKNNRLEPPPAYQESIQKCDQQQKQMMNQTFSKTRLLPFEVTKAQIHDMFQRQSQITKMNRLIKNQDPEIENKGPSLVDSAADCTDFSKLGYSSHENYPGAYAFHKVEEEKDYPGAQAFQKVIEEKQEDQTIEKKTSEFDFFEHI